MQHYLLLPLLLFIALLIWGATAGRRSSATSAFGRYGRPFGCLKFRSMVPDSDTVLTRHFAEHPEARAEWEASYKLTHDPQGEYETSLSLLNRAIRVNRAQRLIPQKKAVATKSTSNTPISLAFLGKRWPRTRLTGKRNGVPQTARPCRRLSRAGCWPRKRYR